MKKETKNQTFSVAEIQDKMEHYCAYQDRCLFEVEKKLRTFILIPEAKEQIISHLYQFDFVNELRFVQSFCRGKFNQKKWGKIKIRQELRNRGLPDGLIDRGFLEIDEAVYLETLRGLIEKKKAILKETNPYKRSQKLGQYLYQKGYDYEDFKKVLDEE